MKVEEAPEDHTATAISTEIHPEGLNSWRETLKPKQQMGENMGPT